MDKQPETYLGSPAELLPTELIIIIMEHLWNRKRASRLSLSRCSKVCSKWRPIAQAMLFTEVRLRNERTAERFISAIQSNHWLGQATRIVDFEVLPDQAGFPPRPRLIKDVISCCPKLYRFALETPFNMQPETFKTLLHPRTLSTLQVLSLSFQETLPLSGSKLCWQDIHYFLHQFSSLLHLRLQDTYSVGISAQNSPLPPPPSFELYEFSWINYDTRPRRSNADNFNYITGWLFKSSFAGLRILDLHECDAQAEKVIFRPFISKYGEKLISIRTSMARTDMEALRFNITGACPDLRELMLRSIPVLSPELRSTLPIAYIEHLGLGEGVKDLVDDDSVAETVDWVMSLPRIRCVTFHFDSFFLDSRNSMMNLWKKRCAKHVQLRVLCAGDNASDQEDMIRKSHFPRGRTIENFSLMNIPAIST